MSASALEAIGRIGDAYSVANGGPVPPWATDVIMDGDSPYGLIGLDSTGQISVYLRGSKNLIDWVENLKVLPEPTPDGWNESGMWEIFCGLSLKSNGFLLSEPRNAYWYGHSQGADEAAFGATTYDGVGCTLFDPARAVSQEVISKLAAMNAAVYSVDGSPLPDVIPLYPNFANRIKLARPVDVQPGIACHELATIARALQLAS